MPLSALQMLKTAIALNRPVKPLKNCFQTVKTERYVSSVKG